MTPRARRAPKRGGTTDRGLGHQHRLDRERLLGAHVDGTPCPICGMPMYRSAALNPDHLGLDADHTLARSKGGTKADRLAHASCNRRRGDGTSDATTRLHTITSRDWTGENR